MQILRQALEEFELTRDVNVDTCASPPEAETITAEAPTQDEEPFFNPQPTSDTLNVTVETQSKRCQATIPVPQRTRRIQVNCPPVVTVSIGTQCSSLTDNVPLRVAAGLVPLPQQPDPLPLASDDEEDDQPGHQDPNYDPMEDSDESESSEGEEDVVTTYPLTGMPSQKTRGSSLSRRPVWHSFCRGVTVVVETVTPMYSLPEVQWWELC